MKTYTLIFPAAEPTAAALTIIRRTGATLEGTTLRAPTDATLLWLTQGGHVSKAVPQ